MLSRWFNITIAIHFPGFVISMYLYIFLIYLVSKYGLWFVVHPQLDTLFGSGCVIAQVPIWSVYHRPNFTLWDHKFGSEGLQIELLFHVGVFYGEDLLLVRVIKHQGWDQSCCNLQRYVVSDGFIRMHWPTLNHFRMNWCLFQYLSMQFNLIK